MFDGLDNVGTLDNVGAMTSTKVSLSGFLVPMAGFDAKLGVLTYEGDDQFTGDALSFGKAPLDNSDLLSDALNPADNFFNGTRSELGKAVSVKGDLPQLSGHGQQHVRPRHRRDRHHLARQPEPDLGRPRGLELARRVLRRHVRHLDLDLPPRLRRLRPRRSRTSTASCSSPATRSSTRSMVDNSGNDASVMTVISDEIPEHTTLRRRFDRDHRGRRQGQEDRQEPATTKPTTTTATRTLTVRVGTAPARPRADRSRSTRRARSCSA